MIEYVLFGLQLALVAVAFLISFFLIKKDRKFIGNLSLAISIGLQGLNILAIFIYKITKSIIIIQAISWFLFDLF